MYGCSTRKPKEIPNSTIDLFMSVAEKTPPHLPILSSCELKEKKKVDL
jgi:hypothetical protein